MNLAGFYQLPIREAFRFIEKLAAARKFKSSDGSAGATTQAWEARILPLNHTRETQNLRTKPPSARIA